MWHGGYVSEGSNKRAPAQVRAVDCAALFSSVVVALVENLGILFGVQYPTSIPLFLNLFSV